MLGLVCGALPMFMKSAMGSAYGWAFTGAGSAGYEDGILANGFDYFGGYYYAAAAAAAIYENGLDLT